MNCLSASDRARVVGCLIEGNSIRSTVRLTGVCKDTVLKLLCDLGAACKRYHDANVRNLRMNYNFCRIHQTLRVTPAMQAGISDHVWSLEELVGLLERRAERAA